MTAAWPVMLNRLVVLFPTLPGWSVVKVYDGPPVTQADPPIYLTVGYVLGEDFGGSYEQTRVGDVQGMLEETGTIRSELVCHTGAVNLPQVRAQAFALVDAWEAEIARDGTLGVLAPSSTSSLAVDVQPVQNTAGSAVRLTVTVTYFSRQ